MGYRSAKEKKGIHGTKRKTEQEMEAEDVMFLIKKIDRLSLRKLERAALKKRKNEEMEIRKATVRELFQQEIDAIDEYTASVLEKQLLLEARKNKHRNNKHKREEKIEDELKPNKNNTTKPLHLEKILNKNFSAKPLIFYFVLL